MSTATGRGTVWFVKSTLGPLVLRQYRRGGVMAKFNKFKFLSEPLDSTRPYKELALLETLHAMGLPVPQPVAGMVRREGLLYEAWLLTHQIPNAQDLYEVLQNRSLSTAQWQDIGSTIQMFHQRNVFHSDLNCHNIMLDEQNNVWLIDFDKCSINPELKNWKKQNLERLKRSFDKELSRHSAFHFNEDNWQQLMQGYQS